MGAPGSGAHAHPSRTHPLRPRSPRNPRGSCNRSGAAGEKLTAVVTGLSARPASWVLASVTGSSSDEADVSAPGNCGDCPGERGAHEALAERRTAPRAQAREPATAGGASRPHDPYAAAHWRPAERLPGRVSGPESEPAAAGAAEGGGRCTRGRELERAVRAGGRLASGLGLRSATAQPPPLRLPEQSAPGGRAPGYKWGGAVGRGGRGRVCQE